MPVLDDTSLIENLNSINKFYFMWFYSHLKDIAHIKKDNASHANVIAIWGIVIKGEFPYKADSLIPCAKCVNGSKLLM